MAVDEGTARLAFVRLDDDAVADAGFALLELDDDGPLRAVEASL